MKCIWFLLLILASNSITAQGIAKTKKSSSRYISLPNNYYEELKRCNSVDVILFSSGKSMEFSDKNAQLPVAFISKSSVKSIDGLKLLGLIMYKIDQKSFIDCDILSNIDNSIVVLKLKTLDKKVFYNEITVQGMEMLKTWLKK